MRNNCASSNVDTRVGVCFHMATRKTHCRSLNPFSLLASYLFNCSVHLLHNGQR